MKLSLALDTTPDEFLTGSIRYESDEWRDVAELMRGMSAGQLGLAKSFLTWLSEQNYKLSPPDNIKSYRHAVTNKTQVTNNALELLAYNSQGEVIELFTN